MLWHPLRETQAQCSRLRTKWDVKFLLVANDQGLQSFLNQDLLKTGFAKAAQNGADAATAIKSLRPMNAVQRGGMLSTLNGPHTPSRFTKVACQHAKTWRDPNDTDIFMNHVLPSQMHEEVRLKHKPEMIIYTDGSKKDCPDAGPLTGAGVYRESSDAALHMTVKPNTQGILNTITRDDIFMKFSACS